MWTVTQDTFNLGNANLLLHGPLVQFSAVVSSSSLAAPPTIISQTPECAPVTSPEVPHEPQTGHLPAVLTLQMCKWQETSADRVGIPPSLPPPRSDTSSLPPRVVQGLLIFFPPQGSSSWCPCAAKCTCTSTSRPSGRRSCATTMSCTMTRRARSAPTTHCSTRSCWCRGWTPAPRATCTARERWFCLGSGPCAAPRPTPLVPRLEEGLLRIDVQ